MWYVFSATVETIMCLASVQVLMMIKKIFRVETSILTFQNIKMFMFDTVSIFYTSRQEKTSEATEKTANYMLRNIKVLHCYQKTSLTLSSNFITCFCSKRLHSVASKSSDIITTQQHVSWTHYKKHLITDEKILMHNHHHNQIWTDSNTLTFRISTFSHSLDYFHHIFHSDAFQKSRSVIT